MYEDAAEPRASVGLRSGASPVACKSHSYHRSRE
jgi:hypothetical protein